MSVRRYEDDPGQPALIRYCRRTSGCRGAQERWVTQGPRVAEFERKFAEYVVRSMPSLYHHARRLCIWHLVAAGIKAGDEVLCPSLSFIATANAIVHAGAVPVFVDIDESTYNMDPNCIESAITPRTKAILVGASDRVACCPR